LLKTTNQLLLMMRRRVARTLAHGRRRP
jgi:hypothetical protein